MGSRPGVSLQSGAAAPRLLVGWLQCVAASMPLSDLYLAPQDLLRDKPSNLPLPLGEKIPSGGLPGFVAQAAGIALVERRGGPGQPKGRLWQRSREAYFLKKRVEVLETADAASEGSLAGRVAKLAFSRHSHPAALEFG